MDPIRQRNKRDANRNFASRVSRSTGLSVEYLIDEPFLIALSKDETRALATDGLVVTEPALPHEARPHPREQEPASLDGQSLNKICSF